MPEHEAYFGIAQDEARHWVWARTHGEACGLLRRWAYRHGGLLAAYRQDVTDVSRRLDEQPISPVQVYAA